MTRGPLLAGAVVAALACGDDNAGPVPPAPEGYPVAYSTNACGPTDGPATRLYLATDTSSGLPTDATRIEVLVYRTAAELQGQRFTFGASSPEGWTGRCSAGGPCEEATSTVVEFRRNPADTLLSGSVRLRFSDGSTVSGGFDAAWRRTFQLCG